MTELQAPQSIDISEIKFYRNKRFFRSSLMSFSIFFYTGSVSAWLVSHAILSVFWDWYFFYYKQVKESDVTPSIYLTWKNMTQEQFDGNALFSVKVRMIAFVVSWLILAIDWVVLGNSLGFGTFFLCYFGMNFVILAVSELFYKWIYIYPNIINIGRHRGEFISSTGTYSIPMNTNNSLNSRPAVGIDGQHIPGTVSFTPGHQSAFPSTAYGVTGEIIPGFINNVSTASPFNSSFGSSTSTPITSSFD